MPIRNDARLWARLCEEFCAAGGARVGEMCRTAFVGHAARKRALQAKVKEANEVHDG
jgi:hypothetical protein